MHRYLCITLVEYLTLEIVAGVIEVAVICAYSDLETHHIWTYYAQISARHICPISDSRDRGWRHQKGSYLCILGS